MVVCAPQFVFFAYSWSVNIILLSDWLGGSDPSSV